MDKKQINYELKYLNIVKKKILELTEGSSARVFLFGSRARGDYKRGSDIDIGFDNIGIEDFRKIELAFELFWEESIVPNKVDLVYFPEVKNDFKKEAMKDVVIWKAG